MKKLYTLFSIILFLGISAQAQVKKGSIFLGGDIGGSGQKSENNNTTTNKQHGITIRPVFGKAIKENLVLGGEPSYQTSDYENTGGSEQESRTYSAGIFLRKYKPVGKSGLYIFLHGRVGYSHSTDKLYGSPTTYEHTKRNTVGVSAYPGISYAVTKKLHFETGFNNLLHLDYFNEKVVSSGVVLNTNNRNGFSINTSLNNISSLYVGLRVLLSK